MTDEPMPDDFMLGLTLAARAELWAIRCHIAHRESVPACRFCVARDAQRSTNRHPSRTEP